MLKRIVFKHGPAPDQPALKLDLSPITILVGPNNAGKSRALVEIEHYCREGEGRPDRLVLDNVHYETMDHLAIDAEIRAIEVRPPLHNDDPDWRTVAKIRPQNNQHVQIKLNIDRITSELSTEDGQKPDYAFFLDLFTLNLDGGSRLRLAGDQQAGDLQQPQNLLASLFVNNQLRSELRRIVFDATSRYIVIDPTKLGTLRLGLSRRPPVDEAEERGIDSRAVQFHREAMPIESASDGIRAFVGIMMTVLAGDPRIILVDEPEAFLHPALAAKLGLEIARALSDSRKRLIVASRRLWRSSVPQMKRTDDMPNPYASRVSFAAAIRSGSSASPR